MKKLKAWMEPRYTKIAIYSIVSAVIVFAVCLVIFNSNVALHSAYNIGAAIMKPLVLGLVIAYLILPIVKLLERKVFHKISKKRTRRNLAVLLIYIILAVILGVICAFVVIAVSKGISSISVSLSSLESLAQSLQADFDEFWKLIEDKMAEYHITFGSIGKSAIGLFSNIKAAGSTLLFALIFSIYFLMDTNISVYWKKAARTLLSDRTRAAGKEFLHDADTVFSGYIRGQTLDALIMGVMVTVFFMLAGVPYASVIGILTGLGNLIPFVGPVVGFASLIIVCLTQMAFDKMIIGAIILILVLAVDGNIINPKLLSTAVEVHPILVFLAIIAGGEVGGIVGMLVAVPCAALIKQQFEKYVERRAKEKEEEAAAAAIEAGEPPAEIGTGEPPEKIEAGEAPTEVDSAE